MVRGEESGPHPRVLERIDVLTEAERKISKSVQFASYKVLSGHMTFEGRDVLEIGGAQSCESMYPFLEGGAASGVVSGLGHVTEESKSDRYNLRVIRADGLRLHEVFQPDSFDIVYGVSIVEHVPCPAIFVEQIHSVLRPGGIAFIQGGPLWSSPKGHHLWVSPTMEAYRDKATAHYSFAKKPHLGATNPLPDWSHLLMSPEEMSNYLSRLSIPHSDIECIIDWVFEASTINRLTFEQIAEAYTNSRLTVLEVIADKVEVPDLAQAALRERFGMDQAWGICNVQYVLKKER
jgi:SAM-dependent methyltransferase